MHLASWFGSSSISYNIHRNISVFLHHNFAYKIAVFFAPPKKDVYKGYQANIIILSPTCYAIQLVPKKNNDSNENKSSSSIIFVDAVNNLYFFFSGN